MSKLPSMPLYVDDYEAATAHLTLAEDGAYNRLLRLCWRSSDCTIPHDDKWIMRRMRVSQAEYDECVRPVLEEFFVIKKNRVMQKRQREIFSEVNEKVSNRKKAAKAAAEARALKTKEKASSKRNQDDVSNDDQSSDTCARTKTKTKTISKTKDNNIIGDKEDWIILGEKIVKQHPTLSHCSFEPIKGWLIAGITENVILQTIDDLVTKARVSGKMINTFAYFEKAMVKTQQFGKKSGNLWDDL